MLVSKKLTQLFRTDTVMYADLLKRMNQGGRSVKPYTLIRNIERNAESLRRDITLVQFLKEKGYSEEEIFEKEPIKKQRL